MFKISLNSRNGLTWSGTENYDVRYHAVKRFYDVAGEMLISSARPRWRPGNDTVPTRFPLWRLLIR